MPTNSLYPEMKATPRNRLAGLLADAARGIYDYAQKPDPTMPMGKANPVLSLLANTIPLQAGANVLDDYSYGQAPIRGTGMTTRLTPDATDLVLTALPFPKTSAKVAGGLLGGFTPGVDAAMFIGSKAKTWDAAAAAKALEMEQAKAAPRAIWSETGTYRAPDGLLRQEVSDHATRMNLGALPRFRGTDAQSGKVADVLKHDPLGAAYADLGGIDLSASHASPTSASYMAGGSLVPENIALNRPTRFSLLGDLPSQREVTQESFTDPWMLKNFGGDQSKVDAWTNQQLTELARKRDYLKRGYAPDQGAKSDLLHELQHAVQQREGFAPGGNLEMFNQQKDAELARDALHWARELRRIRAEQPGMDPIAAENKAIQDYQQMGAFEFVPSREARDLARQPGVLFDSPNAYQSASDLEALSKLYGLDQRTTPYTAHEAYKRLAGEAEARATQARMNMTPAERRATFPLDSYDVPINQLIVR